MNKFNFVCLGPNLENKQTTKKMKHMAYLFHSAFLFGACHIRNNSGYRSDATNYIPKKCRLYISVALITSQISHICSGGYPLKLSGRLINLCTIVLINDIS